MLIYCTSFDHYGQGVAPAYLNSTTDIGWDFGAANGGANDWTILGDAFGSEPTIASGNAIRGSGTYGIGTPLWGARRGDYAFYASAANVERFTYGGTTYTVTGEECLRLAIPGASQHERLIHFAFAVDDLPALELNHGMIMSFQDAFGNIRGYLGVNPSGRLVIYDGADWTSDSSDNVTSSPAVLAVSSSPVITAETWQSINVKITTNSTDANADIQVYVGAIISSNLVINTSASAFTSGAQPQIDILGLFPASMAGHYFASPDAPDNTTRWMRDLVVCDNTGTYNNTLLGQVFVSAQEMRAEDAGGGWSAHQREHLGNGILDHVAASTGVRVGDNANLELGSGDFTVEGFFRIRSLPPTGTITLLSKWQADDNNRSWKLLWDSAADEIKFIVSADGSAETTVFYYPWTPDTDQWYHIAVSRASAVTRLFINGTQLGVDQADATTYFDGTANLGILSEWDSGNTLVSNTVASAYMDEMRLTVGLARYTADFTPTTTKFGRNSTDDPNFTSVELLLGFDDGVITDESSNAFTVTAGTGVVAQQPNDGDNSYEVLNQRPAWDDTYIEARQTFATTILTLTALPTASETVTLGSITYTFVASVSAANEVAIGADTATTLSNLIAAVNAGAGAGTAYGTGTTANADVFAASLPDPQALFTATAIGTAGNSVASTETLAAGAFSSGATLSGGEDIPSPSDFAMERLPVDVTGVLAMQVTARGYKSSAGSAQIRFDLKGPAAAVTTGTAQGTDLSPNWLRQVFEEDPDTAAAITPSTITGGRVRVTRTT